MPKFTDEELSHLSEEERAALADEDGHDDSDEGRSGDDDAEGKGGDDDAGTDGADGEKQDGASDAKTDAATAEKKDDADAKQDDADAKQNDTPSTASESQLPKLRGPEAKDWDALEAKVVEKYEAGELTEAEYRKQLRDIYRDQTTAEVTANLNDQFAETEWQRASNQFAEDHKEYKTSPGRAAALNAHMERIDRETKGALDGRTLLQKAHDAVVADLGANGAAQKDAQQQVKRPQPTLAKAVEQAAKSAPQTLGDLPAADNADTGSDKWAYLDRLAETDGMAFEEELAKLSRAEEQDYLNRRAA